MASFKLMFKSIIAVSTALILLLSIFSMTANFNDVYAKTKTKKTEVFIDDVNGKKVYDFDSKTLTKRLDKLQGQNVTISIKEPTGEKTVVGFYQVGGNGNNPPPQPNVNTKPVSYDQTINTKMNDISSFSLKAIDKEKDKLTYTIVSNSTNGTLRINLPHIEYLPSVNYTGTGLIKWYADDGKLNSSIATVTINVLNGTNPPQCPPDSHIENGVCVPNPPEPTAQIPIKNSTKTLRVLTIADIDCNSNQEKLFALGQKYKVDLYLINGDLFYKGDLKCIVDMFQKYGLSSANARITLGNHDVDFVDWVKNFNNETNIYFEENFGNNTLKVIGIDAKNSQAFGSGSIQYNDIKSMLEKNDTKYKFVMVHQQFQTLTSKHGSNGEFDLYNQLFRATGVNVVGQGHNHNLQIFLIDGIYYLTVGTGTHDSPSTQKTDYPLKSTKDEFGNMPLKTDFVNAITLVDFGKQTKSINGYVVDINDKLVYSFP